MATDKYGLITVDYGTTGWNGVLKTSIEQIDDFMHTYVRLKVAPTETIAPAKPVCIREGEWMLAKEGTGQLPVVGVSMESVSKGSGEWLRAQRVGMLTNSGWSWSPSYGEIWVDSDGNLVQGVSGEDRGGRVGCVSSADTIFIQL